MKQVFLFILLFSTSLTFAQSDALVKKAEQLLEISGAKAQFNTAFEGLIASYQQNPAFNQGISESFWEEFKKEALENGFADLQERLVKLYLENYTEEELDHQIAYYQSPLTQKIVAKQPELTQQSMAIGAEWGQALGEEIARKIMERKEKKND